MRTNTKNISDGKLAAVANCRVRLNLLVAIMAVAVVGAAPTAAYAQSPSGSGAGPSTAPPGTPPSFRPAARHRTAAVAYRQSV